MFSILPLFSITGAIVLSLYYLFLWNPYKGLEHHKHLEEKTLTTASNSTHELNFSSSEPVPQALLVQTPTVTPLLNSTAVIFSTVLIPVLGSIANGINGNSDLVTPKASRYKQKRSSEKVLNFEDKTSFSPFFLADKSNPKTELLMKRGMDSSVLKSEYKRSGEQKIFKNIIVGDDNKGVHKRLRTLGLENVRTESPYEMYNVINPPFYLEDPFTTYAKGSLE